LGTTATKAAGLSSFFVGVHGCELGFQRNQGTCSGCRTPRIITPKFDARCKRSNGRRAAEGKVVASNGK